MSDTIIKGHCPTCNSERHSDVLRDYKKVDDADETVWTQTDYRILQCRGCQSVFFQEEELFSENMEPVINPQTGEWEQEIVPVITYYPAPSKRERPEWFVPGFPGWLGF
jgi:hypothetical protein